jgi:hypothetical protein
MKWKKAAETQVKITDKTHTWVTDKCWHNYKASDKITKAFDKIKQVFGIIDN